MVFLRSSIYCLIFAALFGSSAHADEITCSKAKSSVEKAICQNAKLQKSDAALNLVYSRILKEHDDRGEPHIDQSRITSFKNEQRDWLAKRDALCGKFSDAALNNCIQAETAKRTLSLSRSWLEPACAENGLLTLGRQAIQVGHDTQSGVTTLQVGQKEIAQFTSQHQCLVIGQIEKGGTSAVLIAAGDAYKDGYVGASVSYIVVSATDQGEVKADEIGGFVWSMEDYLGPTVQKNEDGFWIETAALPGQPGERTSWKIDQGLKREKVQFAPTRGGKLEDLISKKSSTVDSSPASNDAFYEAVRRLAPADADRILAALWNLNGGCDTCGENTKTKFYGSTAFGDYLVFSGCGFGDGMICGPYDALAVVDIKSKSVFLALDNHSANGTHKLWDLEHYPRDDKWPDEIAGLRNDWLNGNINFGNATSN